MTETDVANWLEGRAAEADAGGALSPGARIGEWRVVAFLGRGLSGEVYRVTHASLGQDGALKLLVNESCGLKERFRAEADAIRSLSLRALPRFKGSGEHEGRPYYVMEYLRPLPDPFPKRAIPTFMNRVAKAVQMLHGAGFVHRDLKPGNILLRGDGEPVLIDLGLIRPLGQGVTDPIVRHGRGISIIDGKPVGVGTLDFAAPEQLLRGEASVQSDVFALGKMLRSLYAGSPPRSVRSVIRRATRELPSDRFASADDFAAALRHRNYPLFGALLAAGLVLLGVALFPHFRDDVARVVVPILRPPLPRMQVGHLKGESDAAYFNRLLPYARNGNAAAQGVIAEACFYGRGTQTNRAEAVRWYRLAAGAGETTAQASLGLCYLRGWGCARDPKEAVRWYSLAAAGGNAAAMNDLAFCYMHGCGVGANSEIAFTWAMKAAELGSVPAMTMVGECYLDGRGVKADVGRGEAWLTRAALQGGARARRLMDARSAEGRDGDRGERAPEVSGPSSPR